MSNAVYIRKSRYGMTSEHYNRLLLEQSNACAVCKTPFGDSKPNIDHDHNCCPGTKSCGKCLRGLLCLDCLKLAALLETRFKTTEVMFTYLTKYLVKRGD